MITTAWLFDEITDIDRDTDAFKHIVNDWCCIRKSIELRVQGRGLSWKSAPFSSI